MKIGDKFKLTGKHDAVKDGVAGEGFVVEATGYYKVDIEDSIGFNIKDPAGIVDLSAFFIADYMLEDGYVIPVNKPNKDFICVPTPMGYTYIKVSEIKVVDDQKLSSWIKCTIHCGHGGDEYYNTSLSADEVMKLIDEANHETN